MGAPRKFDWDEARRLRAQGMTYTAIGAQFGVTPSAVVFACDGRALAMSKAAKAAYQQQHGNLSMYDTCACGERKAKRAKRCAKCFAATRATQIDERGNLWCSTCKRYRGPGCFPTDFGLMETRKGRGRQCTECGTKAKRAYRDARKVPCANGCGRMVRQETAKHGRALCHVCATQPEKAIG